MTYTEFMRLFPDNDACLDYLKERFFPDGTGCPSCNKPSRFHRIKGRSAYSCQYCGHHAYPTAGTIFHRSTTSLHLWFWAIFLMSSTRCGISAKQLEREIGVTYKTAHRMFKQIRTLLNEDDGDQLSGDVEVDETGMGGKPRAAVTRAGREAGLAHARRKPTVVGMVERGGRVRATVVPSRSAGIVTKTVHERVLPASMIFTDEWSGHGHGAYAGRYRGHKRISHADRIYVRGDVHTNTVEGFFGLLKNGIRGVYHAVSREYLQSYLDEYAWRYNHRHDPRPMFWTILDRVSKDQLAAA
jgi:transposase-like protein